MSLPLVSVLMITYGHETFIEAAIESVLAQDCNFEYELIIADDCSPDNTEKVVKAIIAKHPKSSRIKYTKHRENKGMVGNFSWILDQSLGKYVAICEGDDFWNSATKLKRQVNFLEEHEDYGLVCGAINSVDVRGDVVEGNPYQLPRQLNNNGELFWKLLDQNFIYTLTVCVRRDLMMNLIERAKRNNINFIYDYWFWLNISYISKVKVLNDTLGNYRIHGGGITKQNDFFATRRDLVKVDVIKTCLSTDFLKLPSAQKQVLYTILKKYWTNVAIRFSQKISTLTSILFKLRLNSK